MYARSEMNKTKEQLAEDKVIALGFRIKPLDIEGLGQNKLRDKAQQLWDQIVQLESDKYDLEERQKRQEYDVSFSLFLLHHFGVGAPYQRTSVCANYTIMLSTVERTERTPATNQP
jgi:hypothetical protein